MRRMTTRKIAHTAAWRCERWLTHLFYCDALGEVARFVDVATAHEGGEVGDELQRNGCENWRDEIRADWDLDNVVDLGADVLLAFLNNGEHFGAGDIAVFYCHGFV